MAMPEASVYEHGDPQAGENKVRLSRKISLMKAEAKTSTVHHPAHIQFRFGVSASNSRHVPAALC
jgi:hypothetical protein